MNWNRMQHARMAFVAGFALIVIGSSTAHAAYVDFLGQSTNQSVTGFIETTIRTDAQDAAKVNYYLDGHGTNLIGTSSEPPYFYINWNTNNITPGVHGLGAQVLNSSGTEVAWSYVVLHVSEPSSSCPNMTTEIRNYASAQIIGGLWGAGFGSSGFVSQANTVSYVDLYASFSSNYLLEVHPDGMGFSCQAAIPVSGNCPSIRPIVTITDSACWIYTYN